MPALLWYGLTALGGWIVGSTVNNATETPVIVQGTVQQSNTMPTLVKVGLYVGVGVAAVYLGKKLIAKI